MAAEVCEEVAETTRSTPPASRVERRPSTGCVDLWRSLKTRCVVLALLLLSGGVAAAGAVPGSTQTIREIGTWLLLASPAVALAMAIFDVWKLSSDIRDV